MINIFVVVSERIPRFPAFAINIIKNGNEGMAVIILEQDSTNSQLAFFPVRQHPHTSCTNNEHVMH